MGWLAIAPLLTSSAATWFILENESLFGAFGFTQWTLFFLAAVFTMALALTPTTYMAIVTGYFLGFGGIWLLVLSYQMASVLGYVMTRKLDPDFIDFLIRQYPKANRILINAGKKDFFVAVLSRLSPALPFAMMNLVLAMARVRFLSFFFGGLMGMLPRTLFFVWAGAQAVYLRNAITENESLGWILGLTVVVFGAFYFLLKPDKAKSEWTNPSSDN